MHIQYGGQIELASCYMEFRHIRCPFLIYTGCAEVSYVLCSVFLGIYFLVQEQVIYCSVEITLV